jgi:hypothetical protein
MTASTATVTTAHASRYLQQLCKHWNHKFETGFDAHQGRIDLGEGRLCEMTADDTTLTVTATAPSEGLGKLEEIIEVHIRRFAHREPDLIFDWRPAA